MIKVYSKDNCSNCDNAIKLLTIQKKDFIVTKLDPNSEQFSEQLAYIEEKAEQKIHQFPIIFNDDEYIGGFTELRQLMIAGYV